MAWTNMQTMHAFTIAMHFLVCGIRRTRSAIISRVRRYGRLPLRFVQHLWTLMTPASINTLSSSNTLLLDVVTLLSLQFLLALCGDVHPNPGPCKSRKTRTNNQNTNAENSPVNTKGESVKILGTSINISNWNARGLGRIKEQKFQDLLGLMNENDVQIAIVSKTRECAGSHHQTKTQADGYTIYKNAYHDIFLSGHVLSVL
jgi:hypothetical protein